MKFNYKHAAIAASGLTLASALQSASAIPLPTLGFEAQETSYTGSANDINNYTTETIAGVQISMKNSLTGSYKHFISGSLIGSGKALLLGGSDGDISFTFNKPVDLQTIELYSSSSSGSVKVSSNQESQGLLTKTYNGETSNTLDLSSYTNVTTLTISDPQYGSIALRALAVSQGYPYPVYLDNLIFTVADDNDGLDSGTESQAPGVDGSSQGDGNNDGKQDSGQSNVSSGNFTSGNSTSWFTLGSSSNNNSNSNTSNTLVSQSAAPSNLPANVSMPYGQFSYTVTNLPSKGATVDMELFVPYDPSITSYYKLNNLTNQWDAISGTVVTHFPADNKTKISFSLVEGGPYDDDKIENGTLVDPGGPGSAIATAVPLWGPLGTLLISSLLGIFGVRRLKKTPII
ncbi:MAG: hypothetical protein QM479_07420 [Pseudomonadota bacterium]